MAEALKDQFGDDVPVKIADQINTVDPSFDADAFIHECLEEYEPLSLTQRGWKIAHVLRLYLPQDYPTAVRVLISSLAPLLESPEGMGMAPFLYLPHVFYVAEYGIDHFEESMWAQYELTQRFTAEFSIRPFIKKYPHRTLERLEAWTHDPSVHVRRLVSEGTRPRLPWAPRLEMFIDDPLPVIALLELLKDDPELYVRRSVANNLNDIGKDHPLLLAETARRWITDARPERQWLIRHALRSAVKRGEQDALEVMGFGERAEVSIRNVLIEPGETQIGGSVEVAFEIENPVKHIQHVMVDLRVHYVKANGRSSPKVFKMKKVRLSPGESVQLRKGISLANMSTRTHYHGTHQVDVLLNGVATELGKFDLVQV